MGNFTRAEGAEGRTGSLSTTGARLSARAAPDGEGKGLLRRVKAAEEEIHRLRKELAATEHALRAARQQAIAPAEHELELCALLSPQARVLDINQSAIETAACRPKTCWDRVSRNSVFSRGWMKPAH